MPMTCAGPAINPTVPPANTFLQLGMRVVTCVRDGFRDDFAGMTACLRESGWRCLLDEAWHNASERFRVRGVTLPEAADVTFACAASILAIGATCRYLWPELRALERAIAEGEGARHEWALQTDAQLRRRTLADVTVMRQCMAAFEATEADANAANTTTTANAGVSARDHDRMSPTSRRRLAEMRISEALVLHVADAPQSSLAQSDRVAGLCQLLAHGLGFRLPAARLRTLHVSDARPSLIRFDEAFALLRERLEPDWRRDTPGAPTFCVHPIDVQLFDPAETTDDLCADVRDARRLLTHPEALRRVRSRVVALIAASVREDCGGTGDWRALAERALRTAAQLGMTCGRVLGALGIATRSGVSARAAWRWSDEVPMAPGRHPAPAIGADVAQWVARTMLLAGKTACPPRLAALARGDTPASLVIGSAAWTDLVDGIAVLGREHWRVAYAQVCGVGRA